jgi:hypothetical protein
MLRQKLKINVKLLHLVGLLSSYFVQANVSKEIAAFFFRVDEREMESEYLSGTLVNLYQTTRL